MPAAGQANKITNLFAGVHAYGLLGLVWFDATNSSGQEFSFSCRASMAAFRNGAKSSPGREQPLAATSQPLGPDTGEQRLNAI